MIIIASGLERKEMAYCSLWKDVGVLQGELKNEQGASEFKK